MSQEETIIHDYLTFSTDSDQLYRMRCTCFPDICDEFVFDTEYRTDSNIAWNTRKQNSEIRYWKDNQNQSSLALVQNRGFRFAKA